MYPVLIFWMDEKRVSSVRKGQFFQMPQLMVCNVTLQKIPYVRLGQALTLSRCILLHKNRYGFSDVVGCGGSGHSILAEVTTRSGFSKWILMPDSSVVSPRNRDTPCPVLSSMQ